MKTKPISKKELKKPEKEKKTGRPSLYKPEYDDLARKFCLLGATNEKLALLFEVSLFTIEEWIRVKPGFSRAIREGREIADAQVAASLFHRANGFSHKAQKMQLDRSGKWQTIEYIEQYPPSEVAAMFWLKNRQPDKWREKLEVDQKTITVRVEE